MGQLGGKKRAVLTRDDPITTSLMIRLKKNIADLRHFLKRPTRSYVREDKICKYYEKIINPKLH
jgi:hypothetical protein